jgi:hypothetical protein
MAGYPNDIYDQVNNVPVVRRGITATPFQIDHNGKKEFLIDAACFPGSSGSPVIVQDFGPRMSQQNLVLGGAKIHLLGTLYAGPQHTATGEIIVAPIPTTKRMQTLSRIPNNLGYCIKSERILELRQFIPG